VTAAAPWRALRVARVAPLRPWRVVPPSPCRRRRCALLPCAHAAAPLPRTFFAPTVAPLRRLTSTGVRCRHWPMSMPSAVTGPMRTRRSLMTEWPMEVEHAAYLLVAPLAQSHLVPRVRLRLVGLHDRAGAVRTPSSSRMPRRRRSTCSSGGTPLTFTS
jgi:hypothetical protein